MAVKNDPEYIDALASNKSTKSPGIPKLVLIDRLMEEFVKPDSPYNPGTLVIESLSTPHTDEYKMNVLKVVKVFIKHMRRLDPLPAALPPPSLSSKGGKRRKSKRRCSLKLRKHRTKTIRRKST